MRSNDTSVNPTFFSPYNTLNIMFLVVYFFLLFQVSNEPLASLYKEIRLCIGNIRNIRCNYTGWKMCVCIQGPCYNYRVQTLTLGQQGPNTYIHRPLHSIQNVTLLTSIWFAIIFCTVFQLNKFMSWNIVVQFRVFPLLVVKKYIKLFPHFIFIFIPRLVFLLFLIFFVTMSFQVFLQVFFN